jgi:hypothetical protein
MEVVEITQMIAEVDVPKENSAVITEDAKKTLLTVQL